MLDAKVNYDDEESIIAAFKGQQCLIISLSVTAPQDTQTKLIKAAAKAGVPWVFPNSYTTDLENLPLANESLHAAGVLASIGAIEKENVSSWVAIVSSFWYEFSITTGIDGFGLDVANKKVEFIDDFLSRLRYDIPWSV